MGAILRVLLFVATWSGCTGGGTPAGNPPPEIVLSDLVHVARLSHTQWENSVEDLLGLDQPTGLSDAFIHDSVSDMFDNESADLGVDQVLFQEYSDAGWVLADLVLNDPDVYARVVGPPITGNEPPVDFIRTFGERVHRHPLSDEQVDQYVGAWNAGVTSGTDEDPARNGLRQVLASMFVSPYFLFRVEEKGEVQQGGTVIVNPYDLASRVSYALWNTMPDDRLYAHAKDGSLRDPRVLADEVDRMLDDPRAEDMLRDLHDQLLLVGLYINVAPDTVLYPDYDLDTIPAMQEEVRRFVLNVYEADGGVRDLFTSRRTFANGLLAKVYGLPGIPEDQTELEPVDLDPTERSGLLTLSGFLSYMSDPDVDNPIRRGFFINNNILCTQLPPPPIGVGPIPASDDGTTRDRIEQGTAGCGDGCHTPYINPAGFAFEHYGPTAEYRTEERGFPVDASGTYPFQDGTKGWDDAIGFSQVVAQSPQVHTCYAQHLFQYLYERYPTADDARLVSDLGTRSFADHLPIRDLLRSLVLAPEFREMTPVGDDSPATPSSR